MTDNAMNFSTQTRSPDEDERAATLEVALQKLQDAYNTPGLVVSMDPDEAELLGAFEEDAMSYEDAIEAAFDRVPDDDAQQ